MLAGVITEMVSWRAAFLINLPIVAVFVALVHVAVPHEDRKLDTGLFPGIRLGLVALAMMAISVAAIGIFSAFMLYDIKRVLDGGESNYISATLALYLDIFNVFQSLLALLGIFGGSND